MEERINLTEREENEVTVVVSDVADDTEAVVTSGSYYEDATDVAWFLFDGGGNARAATIHNTKAKETPTSM